MCQVGHGPAHAARPHRLSAGEQLLQVLGGQAAGRRRACAQLRLALFAVLPQPAEHVPIQFIVLGQRHGNPPPGLFGPRSSLFLLQDERVLAELSLVKVRLFQLRGGS